MNMNKNIVKTESVAEFIARGGSVKKVATKTHKTNKRTIKDACLEEDVDFDALPMALKIKYGVR
jgi:hypothetical protein